MTQRHIGKHVGRDGEVRANFHSNSDGTWWTGWTPDRITLEEVLYSALTTAIDAIQQRPELLDRLLAEDERANARDEVERLPDSYVPLRIASEILEMLTAAGYGRDGEANTLWAMTKQATEEVARLRTELADALEVSLARDERATAAEAEVERLYGELSSCVEGRWDAEPSWYAENALRASPYAGATDAPVSIPTR